MCVRTRVDDRYRLLAHRARSIVLLTVRWCPSVVSSLVEIVLLSTYKNFLSAVGNPITNILTNRAF